MKLRQLLESNFTNDVYFNQITSLDTILQLLKEHIKDGKEIEIQELNDVLGLYIVQTVIWYLMSGHNDEFSSWLFEKKKKSKINRKE